MKYSQIIAIANGKFTRYLSTYYSKPASFDTPKWILSTDIIQCLIGICPDLCLNNDGFTFMGLPVTEDITKTDVIRLTVEID